MPTAGTERVVWIVDDSATDAERARRVLQQECHVEVFADGSTALERLASTARPPDVMVLDWVMPGVTGVDVCRFLRSSEGGMPQVGVLLLTTHRRTEQIVEGLSAGANDYLAKPYADAELHARVHALLRSRQLLERAEEAEALSLKLLQMAPDALVALDDDRNIKYVNQMASELLQLGAAVHIGTPLSAWLPELAARIEAAGSGDTLVFPDIKLGDRLFSPTFRVLRSSAQFDILSLHDVTETRRLVTRRLDFYSIIAHDLRSPLTALTLRTHLMLQGAHGALPEKVRADLTKMDRNLQSMVTMINDFLDLARLDNAAFEMQSEKVDLALLVSETMAEQQPLLESKKLRWESEVQGSSDSVGDERRLQQVLTNLIGNAIKFTGEGGTITTRIVNRAPWIEVAVIDTGRGIPSEKLPTLFERYTRATNGKDDVQGTGLGLLIVREIVEAHGGTVGVESQVGVGSRFWFRLPTSEVEADTSR